MNNLYIYGGEKEINIASDDNDYLYHINIGKIRGFGSTIDDIKKVSAIAIAIRDSYVKFIDDLNIGSNMVILVLGCRNLV